MTMTFLFSCFPVMLVRQHQSKVMATDHDKQSLFVTDNALLQGLMPPKRFLREMQRGLAIRPGTKLDKLLERPRRLSKRLGDDLHVSIHRALSCHKCCAQIFCTLACCYFDLPPYCLGLLREMRKTKLQHCPGSIYSH